MTRLFLSLALAGLLFVPSVWAETPSYTETVLHSGYENATGTGASKDTGTAADDEPPTGCRVFLNVSDGPTATTTTTVPATTTTTLGALLPRLDRLFAWLGPESAWAAGETLTVSIVASPGGTAYPIHTFTAVTGSSSIQTAALTECPPNLRADWTIAGDAPGFVFEVIVARY